MKKFKAGDLLKIDPVRCDYYSEYICNQLVLVTNAQVRNDEILYNIMWSDAYRQVVTNLNEFCFVSEIDK